MKKYLLYAHPFLFAFVSLMLIYLEAKLIAPPYDVLRPLLVLWLILLLLYPLAYKAVGNWDVAGVLLTIFVFGFYFQETNLISIGALTGILVVSVYLYFLMTKRHFRFFQVSLALTLIGSGVAVALSVLTFILLLNIPFSYYEALRSHSKPLALRASGLAAGDKPDIYYIVLDGYARADILADLYRFDNSDFESLLESKGFIIPKESRANYPKTALSVTSTLNMDYIESLTPGLGQQPFWWLMSPLLDHSRVRASLESLGYQTVSIATGWGITDNPTTDIYYSPKPIVLTDFESFLLAKTPLGFVKPWLAKFSLIPSFESHRELVRFNFETLAQIPALPGPKFVFAHIIAPHPPFVFDADGNPIQPDYPYTLNDASEFPYDDATYRQGYLGQVQFVNRQLEQLINVILQESKTPPIIILQADHGPGMLTDFHSSDHTCLKERFSIFAAYYLPGMDRTVIPEDIVPANLFRIIFNEYFSADLPVLDPGYFYCTNVFIYRTEDVTSRIDTCTVP